MLGPIVLAALAVTAQPPTAPKAAGQVTAAVGQVTIVRDGRSRPASARSPLYPGDRVETGEKGGAGAFLFVGQSVYLGGSSSLALAAEGDDVALRLDRGEARLVNGGSRGLTVAAGGARARLDRGILRAAADERGSRFWAEDGPAEVIAGARAPVALPGGRQLDVPNAGPVPPPAAPDAGAWKLNVDPLQLSGAADASRRLRGARTDQADDESTTLPGMGGDTEGSKSPDFTASQPVATAQPTAAQPTEETFQPVIEAQPNTASSAFTSSLAFASFGGSSFGSTSGGLNADAQQQSLKPGLAGNINLITAQTRYTLNTVQLKTSDVGNGPGLFPDARTYDSVGLGAPPRGPVLTNFLTGSTGTAQTLTIPHFNAYVVQFNQYGIPDPASTTPSNATSGISGLLGSNPKSPQIVGATPLLDSRAVFNNRATFALGEFALQTSSTGKPVFDLRRSDQDRQIIKSPTGNDNLDKVTLNPDVGQFNKVKDFAFFPQVPYVLQPETNSLLNKPTYAGLSLLEKAAVTTLLADSLFSYARRTGQTRFTLGGQVVDITGYRLPSTATAGPSPAASVRTAGVRPPLSAFGAHPETMRGIAGTGGHALHTVARHTRP